MNKSKVDKLISPAYSVLAEVKILNKEKEKKGDEDPYDRIVDNKQIDNRWRGQIASFGAAGSTGSLLSAIAYFSTQGRAGVNRKLLIKAIEKLIGKDDLFKAVQESMKKDADAANKEKTDDKDNSNTSQTASFRPAVNEYRIKEEIINAAIALKLAMNLYDLQKGN